MRPDRWTRETTATDLQTQRRHDGRCEVRRRSLHRPVSVPVPLSTMELFDRQHGHSLRTHRQGWSVTRSDVKSSRPKWPRPRGFGLGLASISLSYYVIGHFSCKNGVKFGNFVNFSGNNLKSYVVNHYLVLFSQLFLASVSTSIVLASASRFWPRLTSLVTRFNKKAFWNNLWQLLTLDQPIKKLQAITKSSSEYGYHRAPAA